MSIVNQPAVAHYAARKIVPIAPFLEMKAAQGDKTLAKRLKLLKEAVLPNTGDWCAKLGTDRPCVRDKPFEGRHLFTQAEQDEIDSIEDSK